MRPALGDVPPNKLTPAALDRYYRDLLTDGGRRGQGLSPGTIRRIHGILRRALAQGVRWGWLGGNPAASASPPRVPAITISPPTPEELAKLQATINATDPDLGVFVKLAAMTGARRSEMLALRWVDLDLGVGVVTISRGIVMGPDGLVEKDTKTHQTRRVTLGAITVGELATHRERVDERAAICDTTISEQSFVFSGAIDGSEPWFPDSVSRRFCAACDSIGPDDVRLHDLRHYVATRLLSAGSTCAPSPAASATAARPRR